MVSHIWSRMAEIYCIQEVLFGFAIKGQIHDGHQFVSQAYQQGVRNFVVSDALATVQQLPDINAIVSHDVVDSCNASPHCTVNNLPG